MAESVKRCANCKRELGLVLHSCRKCHKDFCSPAVRDCILVHGCGDQEYMGVRVEQVKAK